MPLIIQTLNEAPSRSMNQQWRITPAATGRTLFTIQSILAESYAVIDGLANANKPVVSGVVAMPWEINAINPSSHSITIRVPYTDFVWNLASNDSSTKISLAKLDNVATQKWTPCTTLPKTS